MRVYVGGYAVGDVGVHADVNAGGDADGDGDGDAGVNAG